MVLPQLSVSDKFTLLVCLPTALISFCFPASPLPLAPLVCSALCLLFFSIHEDSPSLQPQPQQDDGEKALEPAPTVAATLPPSPKPAASAAPAPPLHIKLQSAQTGPVPASEKRMRALLSKSQMEMAERLVRKLETTTFEYDHALFAPNLVNAKRFLQSRNWNEAVAEKLWRKAALWRIEYGLGEKRRTLARKRMLGKGFDSQHDFLERHWYMYPFGTDINGVPVIVLGASTADPHGMIQETNMEDGFLDRILDEYERILETAIELDVLDQGLLEVYDLRDGPIVGSFFSRATNAAWPFKSFAKIADEVYVERVRKVIILGPPRVFSIIWNGFQPLIPAETKKKIAVVSRQEDWIHELITHHGFTRETIPQYFGGTGSDEHVLIGHCVPKGSYKEFCEKEFRANPARDKPIGMIADVQYADEPDANNFAGTRLRKYRGALEIGLKTAAQDWTKVGVRTVVQLGDLIDGFAKKKSSRAALQRCLDQLAPFPEVHHLLGNHEMYNFPASKELAEDLPAATATYRSRDVVEDAKFRWIFLNAYEVSVLHADQESAAYKQALEVLLTNHPRDFRKDKDWLRGMYSLQRRFVAYNGQFSPAQLAWLRAELEDCVKRNQLALVCSHVPLKPGSCAASCLVWNYANALSVLQEFACSKHGGEAGVAAVFAGHEHRGGYALDEHGIAYITLTSPLEAEHNVAHSTLHLGREALWLKPYGAERERIVQFHKTPQHAARAFAAYRKEDVTAFLHKCHKAGMTGKTFEQCEQMWSEHEGNWDELPDPDVWPRKFTD